MKGIYITYPVQYSNNQRGIKRKIESQIKAFKTQGILCSELCLRKAKFNLPDGIVKLIQWIPFINIWPRWEIKESFLNCDFLYMRRPSCISFHMINTLKKIKTKNRRVSIYLEIPTFPYDLEMKGIKKLLLLKDKVNRKNLKNYVDYITLPSLSEENQKIFSIPVINYQNGCDFSSVTRKIPVKHGQTINILCVANFQPSHGYERVIYGIANYYNSLHDRKVYLHMAGEGNEAKKYINLTKNLNLEKFVIFHGYKQGKELDEIYGTTDIAVSALGTYKIKNDKISCIKNSEYMAKGVPVIFAGELSDIPEECREFFYIIKNDSTPINIKDIIKYIDNLRQNYTDENLVEKIRNTGRKKFDMEVVMKPIFKSIKDKFNG